MIISWQVPRSWPARNVLFIHHYVYLTLRASRENKHLLKNSSLGENVPFLQVSIGLFQKKFETPPRLRISNFQGVEWKWLDFQEGMSKFEGETRISKGFNIKKWKIPGVMIKLTGNPGGQFQKKLISSTGEVQFSSYNSYNLYFR